MAYLKTLDPGIHDLEFLVSGIGIMETTFHLTLRLGKDRPDMVINAGLAGSFNRSLLLGEVVMVEEEILSELGAENGSDFLTLEEIGLKGTTSISCSAHTATQSVRSVRSITVNTVHGNDSSIEKVQKRFHPDIENMEGAAVFFVCSKLKVPFIELRSISNYVERRNREAWNIPLAMDSLKKTLQHVIETL